jgi:hypothetical protein
MATTQRPKIPGNTDPFSEPPAEVLAEIQAGLDGIYGPSVEKEDEDGLGPEIQLTSDQSRTAVLYYLALNTQNDGWYIPVEEDPEERSLEYKRGIAAKMSIDTGLGDSIIRTTIHDGANQGLFEIETNETRGGVSITNARVTQLGLDAIDSLRIDKPEEVETIDSFFVRGQRQFILFVRKEIDSERKELKREPDKFKKLASFQGLTTLREELARLQDVQSELLAEIEESAFDDRLMGRLLK